MKKKSLRQLAKEIGVSVSYLSQVKNGKRPPSEKVLSILGTSVKQNVKQSVKQKMEVRNKLKLSKKCPQGNSNPCFRLERAMS